MTSPAFVIGGAGYVGGDCCKALARVKSVTRRACAVRRAERRIGNPSSLVAGATQAKAVLGWTPQRAALEAQLRDAWRRHMAHFASATR